MLPTSCNTATFRPTLASSNTLSAGQPPALSTATLATAHNATYATPYARNTRLSMALATAMRTPFAGRLAQSGRQITVVQQLVQL